MSDDNENSQSSEGVAPSQSDRIQEAADQFIPPKRTPGITEAGTLKSDTQANIKDGARVAVDAAGVAATVATAGAAAPAAAGATATAGARVAATESAKTAGKAAVTEAAKNTATEIAAETAAKQLAHEAAKTTASEAISEVVGETARESASTAASKSKIQSALDQLNKDSKTRKAGALSSLRPSSSNKAVADIKRNQSKDSDHRGAAEKGLDAIQAKSGIDARKSLGSIPFIGGALEGTSNIALRADRQRVRGFRAIPAIAKTGLAMAGGVALLLTISVAGGVSGGAAGGAATLSTGQVCVMGDGGVMVDMGSLPSGPIAGYGDPEILVAANIMNAGATVGVSVFGQNVGVMAAMAESKLNPSKVTVLEDETEAIGIFQLHDVQGWGSDSNRASVTTSSTMFFQRMLDTDGYTTMQPAELASLILTQHAPLGKYADNWLAATQLVAALSGINPNGAGAVNCSSDGTWMLPVKWEEFFVSSSYGPRPGCSIGCSTYHRGIDLAPGCKYSGTSKPGCYWSDEIIVVATAAGTVIQSGPNYGWGTSVTIRHEGQYSHISTRYAHFWTVLVPNGSRVEMGQPIGIMGCTGTCTGRHLHFETLVNGVAKDPAIVLGGIGLKFE